MCVIFVSLKQYRVPNQNKSFTWTNHSCLLPRTHIFHLLSRFKAHGCFLWAVHWLDLLNEYTFTEQVSVFSLTQSDYVWAKQNWCNWQISFAKKNMTKQREKGTVFKSFSSSWEFEFHLESSSDWIQELCVELIKYRKTIILFYLLL